MLNFMHIFTFYWTKTCVYIELRSERSPPKELAVYPMIHAPLFWRSGAVEAPRAKCRVLNTKCILNYASYLLCTPIARLLDKYLLPYRNFANCKTYHCTWKRLYNNKVVVLGI